MKKSLSQSRQRLLSIILDEAIYRSQFPINGKLPATMEISITEDDARIVFYGTNPKWWARLFRNTREVSITDLCLHIAKVASGDGNAQSKKLFRDISSETIEAALNQGDYDAAVDTLFDVLRHGPNPSVLTSKFIKPMNDDDDIERVHIRVRGEKQQEEAYIAHCYLQGSGEAFPFIIKGVQPIR